jgi:hypothetical protein
MRTRSNLTNDSPPCLRLEDGAESILAASGSGCPPRGPRPHDVICQTQTPAAPGAPATAPTARDREHRLRLIMAVPIGEEWGAAFEERFGVRFLQGFGMTECNIVAYSDPGDPLRPGCAGRVLSEWFDVRILDPETDEPLPTDTVGEIAGRPKVAWGTSAGYFRMPERTVEAWRNLWFHTGDAGRLDAEGQLWFVERGGGRARGRRGRRRGSEGVRGGRRPCPRSPRAPRLVRQAHAPLCRAALHRVRGRPGEDADGKAPQAGAPCRRSHRLDLGPGVGRLRAPALKAAPQMSSRA